MSNNLAYSELLWEFEKSRKEDLQPILDTLLEVRKILKNTAVIEKIANLSKKTSVVMLNENHWHPKHRKFALQLLKSLKNAGYSHLALALYKNQDSVINNQRDYPTFSSGYNTRESFFAHLIRKAKDLEFIIHGHENYDNTINRKLGQAKNFEKILSEDLTAKLFVYASLDHIVEEPTSQEKGMAAYLKELLPIDPLTLNQVDLVSDIDHEDHEMVLVPYHLIKVDKKFKKKVDFFLLNNLEVHFKGIYPETKRISIHLPFELSQKNSSKEFLVSVYNEDKFSIYKSRSVPILSTIEFGSNNSIELMLPEGKRH
ncbi:hypothetical protein [Salinimicrobium marinum]|nr:hypothetical protein [Salinimicrobium marinum]